MSHDCKFPSDVISKKIFFYFYLDYQQCIQDARPIECLDKSLFCPNFYYVFYAEMEINLNRFFSRNSPEQWSLLFVDYNFMPPINMNMNHFNIRRTAQIFYYEPHILTILHNAKIKYRCLDCQHEWTTARGRAIFQAEIPEINKYNILFAYLFTQKCQKCRRDIEPSWYLDEATRVMRNVSRILIDRFYSHRRFPLSPSISSSSGDEEDEEEDFVQRASHMRDHHHRDLCRACQEGSCYASHWQHQQNR